MSHASPSQQIEPRERSSYSRYGDNHKQMTITSTSNMRSRYVANTPNLLASRFNANPTVPLLLIIPEIILQIAPSPLTTPQQNANLPLSKAQPPSWGLPHLLGGGLLASRISQQRAGRSPGQANIKLKSTNSIFQAWRKIKHGNLRQHVCRKSGSIARVREPTQRKYKNPSFIRKPLNNQKRANLAICISYFITWKHSTKTDGIPIKTQQYYLILWTEAKNWHSFCTETRTTLLRSNLVSLKTLM